MQNTAKRKITLDELLAMPDDGVDRWMINGELREQPSEFHPSYPMTLRNRFHSEVMAQIAISIGIWLKTQSKPRGKVLVGEAGVYFPEPIDDAFGLDVIYVAADVLATQSDESRLLIGVPTLCVEILSPTDTVYRIKEKVRTYLAAGVSIVWIVDPHEKTVQCFTREIPAVEYGIGQRIPEHPVMPRYSPLVDEFFED